MSELEKLTNKTIQLLSERRQKTEQLEAAEKGACNEFLNFGKMKAGKTLKLMAELRVIDAALTAGEERRVDAIRRAAADEAGKLLAQAEVKRRELSALENKTGKLLADLSKLEGVAYTPAILEAQPKGDVFTGAYIPNSARLRNEISALESRARETDRHIPASGSVDVTVSTPDEFLSAVLQYRAEIPTLNEILSWHEDCEAQARKRQQTGFGNLERRYRLFWRNRKIDTENSSIFVLGMARMLNPDPVQYDIGSATFKVA